MELRSSEDRAGETSAARCGAAAAAPRRARSLRPILFAAFAFALLLTSLFTAGSALAISQRGHAFSFSFGATGVGHGQFSSPNGIAVNDSNGHIWVSDARNNRVQEFQPVLNGEVVVGESFVRELPVNFPQGIAVDNSTSEADPSKGDIYVVGTTGEEAEDKEPEELIIYKFSPTGTLISKIKKFKGEAKGSEAEELEEIQGVAVDGAGHMFVSEAGEIIFEYGNAAKNEGIREIKTESEEGKQGFAIDSEGNFYVGEEAFAPAFGEPEDQSEPEEELVEQIAEEIESDAGIPHGRFGIVAELDGATGHVKVPVFDFADTHGVAVNTKSEPANEVSELNDIYLANLTAIAGESSSAIAAFSPATPSNPNGALIQRFGAPGFKEAGGVAVNASTGTVYATDAKANTVDVFKLEAKSAPGVSGLFACTVESGTEGGCAQAPGNTALKAQIDPHGADTHYHFEYGPASCASSPCTLTPSTDVGAGWADEGAGFEIENLPTGTYHYRVVASNEFGTSRSAEKTFKVLAAPNGLPDGRAWEMVSPTEKTGAIPEAITSEGVIQASASGNAFTFIGRGVIPSSAEPEGNRNPEFTQALSARTPSGWNSQDLITANTYGSGVPIGLGGLYKFFSSTLSLGLLHPYEGIPGSGALEQPPLSPVLSQQEKETGQEKTVYLHDNGPRDVLQPAPSELASYEQAKQNGELMKNAGFFALVSHLNAPGGEPFGGGQSEGIEFAGATADLSHVVINSHRAVPGLYEWGPEETLKLVSQLPDKTRVTNAQLGNYLGSNAVNAISRDGSRVIWSTASGEIHLYVRDTVSEETLQLDAVQAGASGLGEAKASFAWASTDGSKVFFVEPRRLTPDSKAGHFTETVPDLYVAELSGGKALGDPLTYTLKDLTPAGINGESANVLLNGGKAGGVIGASDDGTHVYFAANGALSPDAQRSHCSVTEEPRPKGTTCNLYERVYSHGEWTPTRLIAEVSPEDAPSFLGAAKQGDMAEITARVSPNGQFFTFMSNRSLTGYDNEDVTSKAPGERMDEEVFLYNEADETITCVSCNPDGSRPEGVLDARESNHDGLGLVIDRGEIWSNHVEEAHDSWLGANIPGWTPETVSTALYQSRYLNDEGRMFFNSPSHLVPASATARSKVYEYEPNGIGSCAAAGGCVSLISSPTAEHESAFLDASESGNDVFFLTAEKLVQQDPDDSFDIYDARVCGAAGCLQPPEGGSTPCASLEDCRPGTSSPPAFSAPASTAVGVSGNVSQVHVLGEKTEEKPKAKPKPPTRAQLLAKALKACKKLKNKHKRSACEKSARKKYGPVHKHPAKKAAHKAATSGRKR